MKENYSTESFIRQMYRLPPTDGYRVGMSQDEFPLWREKAVLRAALLTEQPLQESETLDARMVAERQRCGYRVEKWEITPTKGLRLPLLLLIPEKIKKAPAVLCTPGWGQPKELLAGEEFYDLYYGDGPKLDNRHPMANAQAVHYARAGLVAAVIDNPCTGELAGVMSTEDCALALIAQGSSYVAFETLCCRAALRFLSEREYVDADSMGISAFSLSTEAAMFTALADDKVKAMVFNDFLADNIERILAVNPPERFLFCCNEHLFPNMHRHLSFPDLLCALAPRPLLICEGGITKDLEQIRDAYRAAGAPENYEYIYYPERQDPESRPYDTIPMPEGITNEEYMRRANVVPAHHFFKYEKAVPWMLEQLKSERAL